MQRVCRVIRIYEGITRPNSTIHFPSSGHELLAVASSTCCCLSVTEQKKVLYQWGYFVDSHHALFAPWCETPNDFFWIRRFAPMIFSYYLLTIVHSVSNKYVFSIFYLFITTWPSKRCFAFFFGRGRENNQIRPPVQGGVEGSVRFLTKYWRTFGTATLKTSLNVCKNVVTVIELLVHSTIRYFCG